MDDKQGETREIHELSDLEITKLCAKAMGIKLARCQDGSLDLILGSAYYFGEGGNRIAYEPIKRDAQAMALVKKFHIYQAWDLKGEIWECELWQQHPKSIGYRSFGPDLNRAICECVAKMTAK